MDDKDFCYCCGQLRPYPTKPGKWEYLENPHLSEYYKSIGKPLNWIRVDVVPDKFDPDSITCNLMIIPEGQTEAIWWPNNAQWRKIE
jgi:hypothetical protein